MKKYVSNRIREAFKIEKILTAPNGAHQIIGEGEQVEVTDAYMEKHDPVVGGYYVRYIDSGYESFCPAKEFEAGNVLNSNNRWLDKLLPNQSFSGDSVSVSFDDEATEAMVASAGLNAPRVVPEKLISCINSVSFYRLTDTLMVCVVFLVNGFTVTGESACVSSENFDWEIGKKGHLYKLRFLNFIALEPPLFGAYGHQKSNF
ncbi:Gp49 family protein [uncultured Microbulbifer sp.]|uniref:Gp49 family protein n=1 Tax=uncultured Microbulbifer sp. TaxID=348147 RepID=UPI002632391E|nr:Gp49 family protein [uncultured Microbulbifer sp.]